MGIFSSYAEMSGLTEGTRFFNEAELAEEMERLEEMECASNLGDDPENACFEAMMIGQENFQKLMMNITNEEVQYMLEHGGEEIVYEGARLEALVDKIKALIDRAWEKIKAIFEKALATINSWISTDKRFVTKFGNKIKDASTEALTIRDSYDINFRAIDKDVYGNLVAALGDEVGKLNAGTAKLTDEAKKEFSKAILGKDLGNYALSEALEAIYGLKEKGKVVLNGQDVLTELKEGKDNKKAIKNAYNNAKKSVAGMKRTIDQIKRTEAKLAKDDNKNLDQKKDRSYGQAITLCNICLSFMQTIQRCQIRALNVHHSNCRKAAARAVRGVKDVEESTDIGAYEGATDYAWLQ